MKVYRLSKRKYASQLNGKGAAKFGNRWNSKGVEMIYTAESRSLAMAEVVVHLTLATLPSDFVMIEIDIPNKLEVLEIESSALKKDWKNNPPSMSTQSIGDEFVNASKQCVMKVPSVVVQGDFNYLINPHHSDFRKIKVSEIISFPFDSRLKM